MSAPDGRHLSFPFRVGPDGRTATVETIDQHVKEEIIQLILTSPGERAFLPEFGGGARRLVFSPIGETTEAMTKAMISQALSKWMGHRITVEGLIVEAVESTITVDLKYRIAGTEDSRRLRFERSGG